MKGVETEGPPSAYVICEGHFPFLDLVFSFVKQEGRGLNWRVPELSSDSKRRERCLWILSPGQKQDIVPQDGTLICPGVSILHSSIIRGHLD